jgi:colanic acid/amylovoran biosynthesis protein
MSNPGPHSPLNLCLMGVSLDVSNLGVRALASSLLKLIQQSRPGSSICALYAHPVGGTRPVSHEGGHIAIPVVNYRLSPRAKLRDHLLFIILTALVYRAIPSQKVRRMICARVPWIKAVAEADIVADIRGGDSFSDIYGHRRMIEGSALSLPVLLMGKKLVLLPQTYGPFDHAISRWIARTILRRAEAVYSRDLESIGVIDRLMGGRRMRAQVAFCPDVAFILDPAAPRELCIEPALPDSAAASIIGLNISGLLFRGGYTGDNMFRLRCDYKKFVAMLIRRLLDETPAHVLIVPHVTTSHDMHREPELAVSREVWSAYRGADRARVHLVQSTHTANEIKAVIGGCDFFIGSRMHACIAGLSQKVPSVGLAYSRKFLGVFESAGVGDMVIDAREKDEAQLVNECIDKYRHRERTREILARRIPEIQTTICETFADLLGGYTSEVSIPVAKAEPRSVFGEGV